MLSVVQIHQPELKFSKSASSERASQCPLETRLAPCSIRTRFTRCCSRYLDVNRELRPVQGRSTSRSRCR